MYERFGTFYPCYCDKCNWTWYIESKTAWPYCRICKTSEFSQRIWPTRAKEIENEIIRQDSGVGGRVSRAS